MFKRNFNKKKKKEKKEKTRIIRQISKDGIITFIEGEEKNKQNKPPRPKPPNLKKNIKVNKTNILPNNINKQKDIPNSWYDKLKYQYRRIKLKELNLRYITPEIALEIISISKNNNALTREDKDFIREFLERKLNEIEYNELVFNLPNPPKYSYK